MRRIILAAPFGVAALMVGVSPGDARSNLSQWFELLGMPPFEHFLTPTVDNWVIGILLFLFVFLLLPQRVWKSAVGRIAGSLPPRHIHRPPKTKAWVSEDRAKEIIEFSPLVINLKAPRSVEHAVAMSYDTDAKVNYWFRRILQEYPKAEKNGKFSVEIFKWELSRQYVEGHP